MHEKGLPKITIDYIQLYNQIILHRGSMDGQEELVAVIGYNKWKKLFDVNAIKITC